MAVPRSAETEQRLADFRTRTEHKPAPENEEQVPTHILLVLPDSLGDAYRAALARHANVTCETLPYDPHVVIGKLSTASHVILAQGISTDAEEQILNKIRESRRLRGMLLEFEDILRYKGKANIGRFRKREDGPGKPFIVERMFNRSDLVGEADKIVDLLLSLG